MEWNMDIVKAEFVISNAQWRNVRNRTGMNMLLSGGRMSENHR